MSTPTAAGATAPFIAITEPTVAPLPKCTSGITATCLNTHGSAAIFRSCSSADLFEPRPQPHRDVLSLQRGNAHGFLLMPEFVGGTQGSCALHAMHAPDRIALRWSEWWNSNPRPPGPEPGALPDCATFRKGAEREGGGVGRPLTEVLGYCGSALPVGVWMTSRALLESPVPIEPVGPGLGNAAGGIDPERDRW